MRGRTDSRVFFALPFLQNARGLLGEAVDAPVRVSVLVADGDGEPAVVAPDHLDGLVLPARDVHGLTFTSIVGSVPGAVRGLA